MTIDEPSFDEMIEILGGIVAGPFVGLFPERVWWVTGFPSTVAPFGFCWEEAS